MARDEFREEVEAGLEGKSREQLVAFAVRSAMRVLPLLAVHTGAGPSFRERREAFGFWRGEKKNTYLLSLLRAYSVNLLGVPVIGINNAAYAAAADAVVNAAVDAAACAAAYSAAYAAAYAVRVIYADAYVAYAADTAAYAAASTAIIAKEIKKDLVLIDQLPGRRFSQSPLWSSPPPEEWQCWLSDFKADVLSLNAGFKVWLDWYEERLQGKPIDVGLLKQWVNIPK
ncbi:hypothetical protein KFZ76_01995 [Methylovulum psychrotolerans]|uniref:hypothetical protein n=1 Tax=Methylovulum psychrotolerans TaxID=1704499 RepID=UPI001BFF789C|nr:hypothetical protein [Methylovulum psychrotolerans]MBT9096480.1 hypothetical protein [Methylovulum psychrotolerans]